MTPLDNQVCGLRSFRLKWQMVAGLLLVLICVVINLSFMPSFPSPETGSSWNGLTPGLSTPADVTGKLGKPRETRTFLWAQEIYVYRRVTLRFNWNILVLVEADLYDLPADAPEKRLSHYIDLYGYPDYVTWTSAIRAGAGNRTLVFLDDGVLVVAAANDSIDAFVRNAAYFQPCAFECAKQRTVFYFSNVPPNPEFGDLPTSELTQDPWGFTQPY